MKRRPARFVVSVVLALCCAISSSAQSPALLKAYDDDDLKATFLIRLATYVSWPAVPAAEPLTLTICLVGNNSLGSSLGHYEGRSLDGRTVTVRELGTRDPMEACDVAYLSRDEFRGRNVLRRLSKLTGVLTVSDREDFSCGGGMVRFLAIDNRLALEVNRAAATDAGLQISSQLLAIAKVPDLTRCDPLIIGGIQ